MELNGKVAVITGGAVRVGRALTLALAEAGCHVFIHYGRSAQPAQETAAEAEKFGVKTAVFSANLADTAATQQIIPQAVAALGQVDILINNAAIFLEEDSFTHTGPDLWQKLFAVNLQAPYLLSQAFVQQLPADQSGKIININDARLNRPLPDHFVYRLTKGGLWQMTEMLAHELAPRITVNAVALGAILPPPGADDSYLQQIADERIPLQRSGNVQIVAQNVLHLLRQDFLTGVTIPLDGGEFL
jgi:NAD(P)-dependent dehydrogenase (short-subunit alcohol dehydrogenase family)